MRNTRIAAPATLPTTPPTTTGVGVEGEFESEFPPFPAAAVLVAGAPELTAVPPAMTPVTEVVGSTDEELWE